MKCLNCEDNFWVCEEHPHKAWKDGFGCCGGAGMPCKICNDENSPVMPPGTQIICSLLGDIH